jgi:hypothetical protein
MQTTGKWLISLVALWSAIGSYFFDWNRTHIYNPHWPPHAKFHNAQTMLLGTALGLCALGLLWLVRDTDRRAVHLAGLLASLYWLTQAAALLFPGTALVDPEFSHLREMPAQLIVDGVMLALLAAGLLLEQRGTRRAMFSAHSSAIAQGST